MHELYERISPDDLKNFIKFKECSNWEIQKKLRYPVYRLTSNRPKVDREGCRAYQIIRVNSAIIRNEDIDEIKLDSPKDKFLLDFRCEGWTKNRGFQPGVKPLVTSHEKIPPRVSSEFINTFWLAENEEDLVNEVNGEKGVIKNIDTYGESIYLNGQYLFDFLREYGYCLIISYYQGRQIMNVPQMSLKEENLVDEQNGGKFELRWFALNDEGIQKSWNSDYWWMKILNPESYNIGKRLAEKEKRKSTFFQDSKGKEFSAFEADDEKHALKSVFFKQELLDRYKRLEKTTVEMWSDQGGVIRWGSYSGVRFYINEKGEIYLIAKDIKSIPPSELGFWSDHNIIPEGEIPHEAWKNYFEAEFVESKPPHKRVVDKFDQLIDKLNDKFERELIDEDIDFELANLCRPVISGECGFLEVIKEYHKNFIETINQNEIEAVLEEHLSEEAFKRIDIRGAKDALYQLFSVFEDEDFAEEMMRAFNIIYDFRQYESHRGASEKKKRALRELRITEELGDYREVYDLFVSLFEKKLEEMNEKVDEW